MGALDKEQLDALRRQVEEDYRLDMGAIERLERRFVGGGRHAAPVTGIMAETRGPVLATLEPQAPEPQPDELTNTLRGMFSSIRK